MFPGTGIKAQEGMARFYSEWYTNIERVNETNESNIYEEDVRRSCLNTAHTQRELASFVLATKNDWFQRWPVFRDHGLVSLSERERPAEREQDHLERESNCIR